VDDQRAVPDEGARAGKGRGEWIEICDRERVRGDLPILARKITDLAGLRESRVAGRYIATLEGIKMASGTKAVSRGINFYGMNMIY
jgi:hypothetical protein